MQSFRAILKSARSSPQKTREIIPIMRNMTADMAETQLRFHPSKGAKLLLITLKSAIANAQMKQMRREELRVISAFVDEGPRLKRSKGRSKGGRVPIIKRTSHVTVIVGH